MYLKPAVLPQVEATLTLSPEHYVDRTFTNFSPFMPEGYTYSGEKFTVIGGTVEDAIWLLERVGLFMLRIGVGFKIATRKQIESTDPEQRLKLLTIYLRPTVDKALLLNDLVYLLRDYRGHEGLQLEFSHHLEGAIYWRNDTTPDGAYIEAGASRLPATGAPCYC